jgi:hypothetical protein
MFDPSSSSLLSDESAWIRAIRLRREAENATPVLSLVYLAFIRNAPINGKILLVVYMCCNGIFDRNRFLVPIRKATRNDAKKMEISETKKQGNMVGGSVLSSN